MKKKKYTTRFLGISVDNAQDFSILFNYGMIYKRHTDYDNECKTQLKDDSVLNRTYR